MQTRVLLVASEAVPLTKTGGLADVITALASQLRQTGVDAQILMPGYPPALEGAIQPCPVGILENLPGGPGILWQGQIPDTDIPVILLDTERFRARVARPYVDDQGVELSDNAVSFGALAHAAVDICAGRTELPVPHIVHANDWHAGLIPALLRAQGIRNVGSVLTIHNLAFQGNYPLDIAPMLGIPGNMLTADGMEFWGKMSFLKAGICYADRITTVSHSYAKEILTPRFGNGMDGALNGRGDALVAIANGIDTDMWNPASDPLIAKEFSAVNLKAKGACKRKLQDIFGLPSDPFCPVFAMGSRITHQKMADVVLAALPEILDKHPRMQLAVLGCGEPEYERGFLQLAAQYPDRVAVHIGYDERRAHALHAGADVLLHPTRFEPYGLTPIYAMRYGAIPVGSRVGGLIDTIVDAGPAGAVPPANATGVLFDGEAPQDFCAAVDRAFELFATSDWQTMQRNAMTSDFSWSEPVRQYIEMYSEIAPAHVRQAFKNLLAAPSENRKKTAAEKRSVHPAIYANIPMPEYRTA